MRARRTFFGFRPPGELGLRLHALAAGVLDQRQWRLHAPEDVHLTLLFLGAVEEQRIGRLVDGTHLAALARPRLALAATGVFGPPDAPRAAWAGIRADGVATRRLDGVRAALVDVAARAGVPPPAESTAFVPHLTLARPRGRVLVPPGFLALVLDEPWCPDRVHLFESRAGASADSGTVPRYLSLAEFPLAPAAT